MKKLEALFLRTKMTWKTVLLLALGCGVAVGLLMVPEALASTSLQQPGISFVRVELKQHDYRTVEIQLRDAAGEIIEMSLDCNCSVAPVASQRFAPAGAK